MFQRKEAARRNRHEADAMLAAIDRSAAVIEFQLDGTIITANENFLSALGYRLEEIQGKHHSLFVEPVERDGDAYRAFWDALRAGRFQSGEFRRVAKGGREVWIQAFYNPILDEAGRPYKVVKFASDITEAKQRSAESASQIAAIDRSQAVIEFELDGTIRTANENFLETLGYELAEIEGRHHSMFVDPAERESADYKAFWQSLRRGTFQSGEFRRLAKGGREVWIQATYNPILDAAGRPYRVVKFASDVTEEKRRAAEVAGKLAAIARSQAVIEFELDGTIITANENFLQTLGYELAEIQGRHHSIFLTAEDRDSADYAAFWQHLGRGEFHSGRFRRIAKGGREVWIQATYNPILDARGRPVKVVKFAADVTARVAARAEVRRMLEDVGASAEEMNASVREIAQSMTQSKANSDQAEALVRSADSSTERLSEAAKSMGGILEAIDAITAKINLLALNATIESARAGEAGKGFAVVANEVKGLAGQAKTATEEIAREIGEMRGVSSDVVANLSAIREAIGKVNEYVTATTAAVDEQSNAANEMSAAMQRATQASAALG